ncbi:cell division protein SepF [Saccharopolyspora oryzae]|uniref:Cell division protein SepF n=1 Tax=Saccharopolyspora oryzae TaxID=2997343 RepID=A0ABT4UTL4_9PSEU|nr:cell division protein SepF [Saccharopolyspora oryzae]MDA3624444.1 cell division protein SepF [Saccharopolyspora oryzae]
MSALHKLKAYFGMVPADEVDEYDDEVGYRDRYAESDRDTYDGPAERGARRRVGTRGGYQSEPDAEPDFIEEFREPAPRPRRQWSAEAPPRSSLPSQSRENVSQLRAVTDTGSLFNLSKITTLHPRSYSEARTIGEQYRDGTPVIMNLTEMEEADAKRLVDFAAGLAFALRGSIEKVTNRVFLLSPPNVDVAAEDKRRLAEGAFFNYG